MKIRTIIVILLFSLIGCNGLNLDNAGADDRSPELSILTENNSSLAETTAPKIIRQLSQNLPKDSPQIKIIAPKAGQILKRTDVEIELAAQDFSVFESKFGLGNHLNLIIDNEPLQEIYNIAEPIIIENLAPGTHTLRVFAVRPWGESIKTQGAYAQTTFNVLTETQDNLSNPDYPLLTYNSPTGNYGAEPILLDFYLSNSDFSLDNTNSKQYAVKATANGTSFIINDWQPYYLTGFEPGDNWIQLELVDNAGRVIENTFNNTVRVFSYNPEQEDALAKLVTEQVSFNNAKSILVEDDFEPLEPPEIIDYKAIAEPDVIVGNQASSLTETSDRNSDNQTESELNSVVQPKAIAPLIEQKSEDIEVLVEDNLNEQIESEADLIEPETSPSVDLLDQPAVSITNNALEPETEAQLATDKAQKIIISEPDDSGNPVAEIIISQPKSVEIIESEIAITIPDSQIQPDLNTQERSPRATLWWKKILVGIRQTIESIARKLPSEV